MHMKDKSSLYGLLAEFKDSDELLKAAERTYAKGYRNIDAYTPMPIHGLAEAMGSHSTKVPLVVLIGALTGCTAGFMMQVISTVLHYPQNIGGRPFFSWPAYMPITFECTILFAAFSAVFGMLIMNGLPRPYHPLFNVDRFSRVTQDGFFLCIESEDPLFDENSTAAFLKDLGAAEVSEVQP